LSPSLFSSAFQSKSIVRNAIELKPSPFFQISIVTVLLIVAISIGVICRIQCQTVSSSPMIPASPRTESEIHDKNLQATYGKNEMKIGYNDHSVITNIQL
jgi:hypothetical protein